MIGAAGVKWRTSIDQNAAPPVGDFINGIGPEITLAAGTGTLASNELSKC